MQGKRVPTKALKNVQVRDTLACFFAEKETRPELTALIWSPPLMYDYLSLEIDDREGLEELRFKNPQYLEGSLDEKGLPNSVVMAQKSNPETVLVTYYEIAFRNALPPLIDMFIQCQPHTDRGPVALQTWFDVYDPLTGEKLSYVEGGKTKRSRISPARRFLTKWGRSDEKKKGINFDAYIESRLRKDQLERLHNTSYFKQLKVSVERGIVSYIEHRPKMERGYTTLDGWFGYYDINTGQTTLCDNQQVKRPQGRYHYERWTKSKSRKKGVLFDEWALNQVNIGLQNKFLTEVYGIEEGKRVVAFLNDVMERKVIEPTTMQEVEYMTAYFSERIQHPEIISQFGTPFEVMKYLSLSPKARLAIVDGNCKGMNDTEKLVARSLTITK